ncbi:MAG: DUF4249 domain-containing protein [Verrucomicrobia bacterium]|nr:DUF4249 domain-containing protein [Cytophagales bacterium]
MKKNIYLILSILCVAVLSSCEDVVQIGLKSTERRLAVDAWLNNKAGEQLIKLRFTSPYLDTLPALPVEGATVNVTDNAGKVFVFTDEQNNGNYIWKPAGNEVFGKIGNIYTLQIVFEGETYEAISKLNPVPAIDSISIEFRDNELGRDDGYYAILNAFDFPETNNAYWIKAFKNGSFLKKPGEINIAYDAGFRNSGVNNQAFIVPIAEGLNPIPEEQEPPYVIGDSVRAEIWSINEDGFTFLTQLGGELSNGGLFATIPANISSNIKNKNAISSKVAVGFFSVSAVSSSSQKVE